MLIGRSCHLQSHARHVRSSESMCPWVGRLVVFHRPILHLLEVFGTVYFSKMLAVVVSVEKKNCFWSVVVYVETQAQTQGLHVVLPRSFDQESELWFYSVLISQA